MIKAFIIVSFIMILMIWTKIDSDVEFDIEIKMNSAGKEN